MWLFQKICSWLKATHLHVQQACEAMGVIRLFAQYFLWSYYCFSRTVHTQGQILPCSWLAKRKETEDSMGRRMSLSSFLWHGAAAQAFCCIMVMHKEDGNQLYSWPCHRLWGPISQLPGNSRVHCHLSLVGVTMVTSWGAISKHCLCEPCSHKAKAASSPFWHHVLTESGSQPALLCLWPLVLCSFQVWWCFFLSAAGEDFDNLINPWTEPVQICVL